MKWKIIILSFITGMFIAGNANALNYPGYITINLSGSTPYMYGTYNVGTNPRAGHENSRLYLSADVTPAGGLIFIGYDAVNSISFSCSVSLWSDPGVLKTALSLMTGINDGTYLFVRSNSALPRGECTYIYVLKTSYFQR